MKVKQIILCSYPDGLPKINDFTMKEVEVDPSDLKGEQLFIQLVYVSVDPYLRYRMVPPNPEAPFGTYKLNEPINSIALARVIESKSDKFKKGEIVTSSCIPWQEYTVIDVNTVQKVPDLGVPLPYHLHSLGMTGLTAYFGLLSVTDPKPGETVLVSAAAGAVGMMVGQIAKIKGCKVYGIAGGDEKVKFIKDELGFDDALDYKKVSNMDEAIKNLCPNGIDVYFDNVGGETLEAVFLNVRDRARISICGTITQYNEKEETKGPRRYFHLVSKNVKMEGFLVGRFRDEYSKGIKEIATWLMEGKIKEKIDERKGFESIVEAFIGLFKGSNIGKVVVKIAE